MFARVKLLPQAIALIEKYKDDTRDTLFPMIYNGTIKRDMQGIQVLAGIKGNLSYHMSHNSFASLITLEEGVPIETVSKILGHTSIKTTQIYAKVISSKISNDMDLLEEKLSGMEQKMAVNF